MHASFSVVELLRLIWDSKSSCSSSSYSFYWVSASSTVPVPVPMLNGKKFPKVFFTLSEKEEDVAGFSVTPYISSRSRVPVEVAKSWPYSTGLDSLANLLFPLPFGPCLARISSMAGSGWTSTSNIAFCLSEDF